MQNIMIGHKLLFILFAFVLCEPPEQRAEVNFLNQTETELTLSITNYPIFIPEDSTYSFQIIPGERVSAGCFTYSKQSDPITNLLEIISSPTVKPEFRVFVDSSEVLVWTFGSNKANSPFSHDSWSYEAKKSPIYCGDYSDNGNSIVHTITNSDLILDE